MAKEGWAKKKKAGGEAGSSAHPAIPREVLDQLLEGYTKPEDLLGEDGLIRRLLAAVVGRAMDAELTHHLGYAGGGVPPSDQPNRRNGKTQKSLRTDLGPVTIDVPRDREGSYEPRVVPKHQRHFGGFDDKIIAMYARGMSVRDISAHIEETYGVSVSAELVSQVTDAVVDELRAWQQRPLEAVYCIVYIDALVLKIRGKSGVCNMAAHIAVGVTPDGKKEVLGVWMAQNEGAKFWLSILTEIRQRGVDDILVLCADGLTGLPEAVEAAYPQAIFQTCIVHLVRQSVRFVPWQQRRTRETSGRPSGREWSAAAGRGSAGVSAAVRPGGWRVVRAAGTSWGGAQRDPDAVERGAVFRAERGRGSPGAGGRRGRSG